MEVLGAHDLVMGRQVMLGEVFRKVGDTTFSIYDELDLFHPVLRPVKLHVSCL